MVKDKTTYGKAKESYSINQRAAQSSGNTLWSELLRIRSTTNSSTSMEQLDKRADEGNGQPVTVIEQLACNKSFAEVARPEGTVGSNVIEESPNISLIFKGVRSFLEWAVNGLIPLIPQQYQTMVRKIIDFLMNLFNNPATLVTLLSGFS